MVAPALVSPAMTDRPRERSVSQPMTRRMTMSAVSRTTVVCSETLPEWRHTRFTQVSGT
jgi:hypothetical protein